MPSPRDGLGFGWPWSKSASAGTPWPREGIGRSPLKNMEVEHFFERFLLELDTQDETESSRENQARSTGGSPLGDRRISGSRSTPRQRFSALRLGDAWTPQRA